MKHFMVQQAGEPLQFVDQPLPDPQADEVQIKIGVAGVVFADILIRNGLYPAQPPFPLIPGYEVIGIINQIGQQVTGLHIGQRVAALTVIGGYAERVNVPAADVVLVPDSVDPVEAVSLMANYLTAYQILYRTLRVKTGETVLVHSAAGGVGTALLQLGKLAGLELFGTASKGKQDLVRSLGATPMDYQNEDFVERIKSLTGAGVDIVLDPIGGDHLQESYRALNAHGRLLAFGTLASFQNGKPQREVLETYRASIEQFNVLNDGRSALTYSLYATKTTHPDWIKDDLAQLFDLLAAGKLHPMIDRRLPLEQAPLAHELLQSGRVTGKVVLVNEQA